MFQLCSSGRHRSSGTFTTMSELDWTSRAAMGHADALARAAVGHSFGVVPRHLACDVCLGPLDDEESLYADQCSSCIEEAGGLSCLNATLRLDEPGWVARVSALREELYAKGKGKGKNQWARAQAKEARAKSKADSLARAAATMAVHCTRTASACRSACGVCGEPLGIDNIYENGGPPSASRWGPPSADQCNSCWNAILALAPIDEAEQIDQACPDAWAAHSNNPSGDAGALAGALKGVGSGKGYVFRFKGHGKGKFFGFKGAGSGKGYAYALNDDALFGSNEDALAQILNDALFGSNEEMVDRTAIVRTPSSSDIFGDDDRTAIVRTPSSSSSDDIFGDDEDYDAEPTQVKRKHHKRSAPNAKSKGKDNVLET